MSESKLYRSSFFECDQHLLKLINAKVIDCSFKSCNLLSANLSGACMTGTSFEACDMRHMNAEKSFITKVTMNDVKLNYTSLNRVTLFSNRIENATTNNMLLVETKLDMLPDTFSARGPWT